MKCVLPLPPSLNSIYRVNTITKRVYKVKEAKAWQEEAEWKLKLAPHKENYPICKPVAVDVVIRVHHHDIDIDNALKLLFDSLQNAGVIDNDRSITRLTVDKVEQLVPSLIVTVTPRIIIDS